jgi:hypothetical protein
MEPNFQTSFIPKKPMITESVVSTRPAGIFIIISIFVLFTALLATGGLYFYKLSIIKTVTEKETQLDIAKNSFEPSKITQLKVLDKRLNAASEILSHHIVITPIFKALSLITMKTVRYTKFSYNFADSADGKSSVVNIKMSGQAVGYRSIALQSDLFNTKDEAKNFIDPIFSNLTLDNKGNVLFDLEFSVDPSFVDYKQMLTTQS